MAYNEKNNGNLDDASAARAVDESATANLGAVIKDLETQMRDAATNLEFEKAARLRDEIKRLRTMELDTLEGEVK